MAGASFYRRARISCMSDVMYRGLSLGMSANILNNLKHPYAFHEGLRIWARPAAGEFKYSDGDGPEERIFEILRNSEDVSSQSLELAAQIDDWPTEYHLSSIRQNLLRPFTIQAEDDILELGCGCGAITRHLGETGANVIAVEGSPRRAAIAAERCRDLPNVAVICDNFASLQLDRKFKVVTLIGVLEYSNLFIEGENPVLRCLELARRWVADDGILIVAIENQLGLKYFNACDEDHVGQIAFGLNDLYDQQTPVTFGRRELMGLIRTAGFPEATCYYPFPDYKLPSVVVSDSGLEVDEFVVADLVFRNRARDYTGQASRLFSEPQVWNVLERNGLVSDFANSFLVIAGAPDVLARRTGSWLAKAYSSSRKPSFQVETIFSAEHGTISVSKSLVSANYVSIAADAEPPVLHRLSRDEYLPGSLYINGLERLMLKGADIGQLAGWLLPWLKVLDAYVVSSDSTVLSGEALDLTPFNLVQHADGSLRCFDLEWHANETIPRSWVLLRGLVYALGMCTIHTRYADMTLTQLVSAMLREVGVEITDEDWSDAQQREAAFQVYVAKDGRSGFLEQADRPLGQSHPLYGEIAQLLSRGRWQELHRDLEGTRKHAENLERARNEMQVVAEERLAILNAIYTSKSWRTLSLVRRFVYVSRRARGLSATFFALLFKGGPGAVLKRMAERRQRLAQSDSSAVES
ncbi:hypothetical protein D3C72_479570 [compost metagenome]